MPDPPAATSRSQSGWGTPLQLSCPMQNRCNLATANLPAVSPALSARDSTIPEGYAFDITGITHGSSRLAVALLEM